MAGGGDLGGAHIGKAIKGRCAGSYLADSRHDMRRNIGMLGIFPLFSVRWRSLSTSLTGHYRNYGIWMGNNIAIMGCQ